MSRAKLVKMRIVNVGCIGPEGLTVELDEILCLVGANNTGKSTILIAYEMALGVVAFDPATHLSTSAGGAPAIIEIWVHIPKDTPNIAEKWKSEENGLQLVQSKWEWASENKWGRKRFTWDPETKEYSPDGKAGGLDNVFNSRLPKPFRIGTLEDPQNEHKRLLTLILQPISARLNEFKEDASSALSKALEAVGNSARGPVEEEKKKISGLTDELNRSHNAIFPNLKVDFKIEVGDLAFDPMKLLQENSQIKFEEFSGEVSWRQQGTGSQRALFWTMLQVRSKLDALAGAKKKKTKAILDLEKTVVKAEKDEKKASKTETKEKHQGLVTEAKAEIEKLKEQTATEFMERESAEGILPSYMLLIDEPEVALHPSAVRAASDYLYGLAEDPSWQVMLSTHSPQFIDPLRDHTTIVRLARDETNPSPKTFKADDAKFNEDEKEELKLLNRYEMSISEMFFGQYPVIIEGDTEYAAFTEVQVADKDRFPVNQRPVLIRARGKRLVGLVARILRHFKVSFSVLHDADSPRTRRKKKRDGKEGKDRKNSAWTENEILWKEIEASRRDGIRVVHRVSIPNFEGAHLPISIDSDGFLDEGSGADKPWYAVKAIREDASIAASVATVLLDLIDPNSDEQPFEGDYMDALKAKAQEWAKEKCPRDPKFTFD